jgi:hypothetical protein
MRTMRRTAVAAAVLLALAGCDGGPAVGLLVSGGEPLVGSFVATEAVFTDNLDPAITFDVLGHQGTLEMDFRADRTFTSTLAIPGRATVVANGTFALHGGGLRFTQAGVTRTATLTRDGTGLRIEDPGVTFDFAGTGMQTAATMRTALVPR